MDIKRMKKDKSKINEYIEVENALGSSFISESLKKRCVGLMIIFLCFIAVYMARSCQLTIARNEKYSKMAFIQHTRSRTLKSMRGNIYDRNKKILAENKNVYTVYSINLQIKDKKKAASIISSTLDMKYEDIIKKLSKRVALEVIKKKVSYEEASKLRESNIKGIEIDEDYKRMYKNNTMLCHSLGFCGGDNQGIIGLEAKYDSFLKGENGLITAYTDSRGKKLNDYKEIRIEPKRGDDLILTIDETIQKEAEILLEEGVMSASAKCGALIVMNPKNGEILALCNYPNFDLNKPFELSDSIKKVCNIYDDSDEAKKNDALNKMWRNYSINDTYEPGSIFKIFTTTMGLESGKLSLSERFFCPGYRVVEDRRIKCWRFPRAHGSLDVTGGLANSCNPVFMDIARRCGKDEFYKYAEKLKLKSKTGIDLPGEASGIFLPKDKIGPVEISVMGFGQSFQITPIQLIRMISTIVNGGYDVTPHFAKYVAEGGIEKNSLYSAFDTKNIMTESNRVITDATSKYLQKALLNVVENGGAKNGAIEGYKVAAKTATSEKLPRRQGKYIGGYMSFAPYDDPEVIALCLIDEPQGQYYGSVVSLPIVKKLYEKILPYLDIKKVEGKN